MIYATHAKHKHSTTAKTANNFTCTGSQEFLLEQWAISPTNKTTLKCISL